MFSSPVTVGFSQNVSQKRQLMLHLRRCHLLRLKGGVTSDCGGSTVFIDNGDGVGVGDSGNLTPCDALPIFLLQHFEMASQFGLTFSSSPVACQPLLAPAFRLDRLLSPWATVISIATCSSGISSGGSCASGSSMCASSFTTYCISLGHSCP